MAVLLPFGAWRRIVRFAATNFALAIAAAVAVGLFIVVTTVTAAWVVSTGLDRNSQCIRRLIRAGDTGVGL